MIYFILQLLLFTNHPQSHMILLIVSYFASLQLHTVLLSLSYSSAYSMYVNNMETQNVK